MTTTPTTPITTPQAAAVVDAIGAFVDYSTALAMAGIEAHRTGDTHTARALLTAVEAERSTIIDALLRRLPAGAVEFEFDDHVFQMLYMLTPMVLVLAHDVELAMGVVS